MNIQIKQFSDLSDSDLEVIRSNSFYAECSSSLGFQPLDILYQQEYQKKTFENETLIAFKGKFIKLILFSYNADDTFGLYDRPTKVFENFENENERAEVFKLLIKFLKRTSLSKKQAAKLYYHESLAKGFYDNISSTEIESIGVVNLSLEEKSILSSVRKSYRSLINWGKNNLEIKIIDKNNPSEVMFNKFKDLHIEVAQRQTRSSESWRIQYDQILAGQAYTILGFLEGRLVTGALNILGKDTAVYGVAASDRTLMADNKPIGHWPVLKSILYAKDLGCRWYSLGNFQNSQNNSKLSEIQKFKRGFCTEILAKPVMYIDCNF